MNYQVKQGYKQTEVGVIPEDWKIKNISDFHPFVTSGSRGWAKFYSDQGYGFIRITNLVRNSIYMNIEDLRLVDLPKNFNEGLRTELKNGDLLISATADIGIIGYVSDKLKKPAYINQHIALVRFEPNKVFSKFVSYFLASYNPQKKFKSITDTGAKAGINLTTVKNITIALPPTIAEQEKIAKALSDVDSLIESLEDLIAKKRNIKQGAMQELLTGKRRLINNGQLTINNGYKQTELGLIPEDWDILPLSYLIWFQEGPGLRNWQFKSKGLKVINVTNLQENGFLDLSKTDRHISIEEFERMYKHFLIDEDDVVMASSGNSYCKTSIVRKCDLPLLMNTSVIRFKPKEKMNRLFMLIYLKSQYFKNQIDLMITGGAQPNFGPFHLNKIMIVTPSTKAEQEAIAEVLTDMDNEITALEEKLQKTRHLKQGMMQELLTGKTRLI